MAVLDKEYDVIVIGGGINGLACAAYLQKSGLKVAVFERRVECGTHCCTEELMHPGVKVNLCATLIGTLGSPSYDELELERFGLELLTSSEWAFFNPFKEDRSAVLLHSWDARKQYEAWRRINEKDAEVYRRIANYFAPYMVEWGELTRFQNRTPEVLTRLAEILGGCPDIPPEWPTMSGIDMTEALYTDDRIKQTAYSFGILGGYHPWEKGSGQLLAALAPVTLAPIFTFFTPRGGSHALTHALSRCLCHYGGSIFTSCPVAKIIVENGEAKGIALSRDAVYPEAEIRATKAVVSDLSCHPTFLDLVGEDKLPPWAAEGAKAYSYEDVILFTNYWALSEPLDWEGAGYPPEISQAFGFNFGLDTFSDVLRLKDDLEAHRPSDPPIACGLSCQGYCFADPTQAPPGQYTLMVWSNVPYDLDELGGAQAWDDIREEYGDKVEDLLAEYVPNIKKAKIGRYCETPLGFYRRNPSAIKGSAISGANIASQMGENCPFPGCGAPRTPIAKLYISNSLFPQGTADLHSGYKAADMVAQDLGLREQGWWVAKPLEPGLKVLKRRGIEVRWSVD